MDIRTAVFPDLDGIRRYDRHIPLSRLEDCVRRGQVDVLLDDGRIVGILPEYGQAFVFVLGIRDQKNT